MTANVTSDLGERIASAVHPRISMMRPFPRFYLLRNGYGLMSLFPRAVILREGTDE